MANTNAPDASGEAMRTLREATVRTLAHNIDLVRGWFVEYAKERYGTSATALTEQLDTATLRGWFEDWLQRTVASDARFGGRWLADLVEAEAGRAAAALAVRDRVAFGAWTRAFALGGRARADAALPPPSQHLLRVGHAELPAGVASRGELEARAARDTSPLPDTEQREGYHGERHFDFWVSGLGDALAIERALERHGKRLTPGSRVLELGCASGRVLRHFRHQWDGLDVWGCDINSAHVEWIGEHLPGDVCVFQNTVLPSLPLGDASCDLVCAFSVFTHIDEFERSWIAELARVLKPGGVAYLTVHTEHTWSIVDRAGPLRADLERVKAQVSEYEIGDALFAGPLPHPRTVFRWTAALSNNTTVFLATDHIRRAWGRFLEVVEIVREGASYQDVVVLRKR
jgi:SAM-dependent methyltransferase